MVNDDQLEHYGDAIRFRYLLQYHQRFHINKPNTKNPID